MPKISTKMVLSLIALAISLRVKSLLYVTLPATTNLLGLKSYILDYKNDLIKV